MNPSSEILGVVQEALEDYELLVVHSSRRVYKLEEIEYPDVSPSKSTADVAA